MAADAAQIDKPINCAQQMALRDMILQRKLVEQPACATCLGSIIAIQLPR